MLKEVIDKLTSIYEEYGDMEVCKTDEHGGISDVTPDSINTTEWEGKDGSTFLMVEL